MRTIINAFGSICSAVLLMTASIVSAPIVYLLVVWLTHLGWVRSGVAVFFWCMITHDLMVLATSLMDSAAADFSSRELLAAIAYGFLGYLMVTWSGAILFGIGVVCFTPSIGWFWLAMIVGGYHLLAGMMFMFLWDRSAARQLQRIEKASQCEEAGS